MKRQLPILLLRFNTIFGTLNLMKSTAERVRTIEFNQLFHSFYSSMKSRKVCYILLSIFFMSNNIAEAQNVTVSSGQTLTISVNTTYSSLTVNNGGSLIILAPATLTVGVIGNPAATQVVDFQNGSTVNINSGAFMVVYGLLNNSNNSDQVTINGDLYVDGNYQGGQKSAVIGTGTFNSTGKMTTDGNNSSNNGLIFNSPTDCNSGPCSGNNLSCSIANTISTSNQSICQGNSAATLVGSSVASATYQWQSSPNASTFSNISGATSKDYSPGAITSTTYYLRIATTTCSNKSSQRVIIVTSGVPTGIASITGNTAVCQNTSYTYSVSGVTAATGYTWSVPSGASITGGSGTSSITVTMGSVNGVVSVVPYNVCGNATGGTLASTAVTVSLTNAATIAYTGSPYCANNSTSQVPTITGTSGGTFSITGGTVRPTLNTSTGAFTPNATSTATKNTPFTVTYTMAATSCPSATATTTFIISSSIVGNPNTPSGTTPVCQYATGGVYSIAAPLNATNYTWTVPTGVFITSGGGTRSITVTMGNVSGNFTVTPSSAACTGTTSNPFAVTVNVCPNTWTGSLSTAWDATGNWSLGTLPTFQSDVIIPATLSSSRWPVIASGVTATAANIALSSGGTSSLVVSSGGTLNVYGSVENSGSFTASSGSNIGFLGTSAQTITRISTLYNTTINNSAGVIIASGTSSALTVKGRLLLTSGTLSTNGNLTIDIDNGGNIGYASGDAGTVSGNVTVFRAVNSITTHYISCPLDGVTANDLADDVQVINPATTKTRLFQYNNATLAWTAVNDMGTAMSPVIPYSMWFPAATSVDFTGTYNHGASYTYTGGNAATKFMFVSNPYPSALDWEATGWTKTGVKNAVYFWNPTANSYSSYINGLGTNSASQYIPAMNSFFVAYDGNAGTPTATVGMTNSVRTPTYKALWRTAADETVRITLKNSSGAVDETIIRFNEAATDEFDNDLDAYKFLNATAVPSIYTINGSTKYSINSISSWHAKDTIPVFTKIPADGEYVLSIDNSDPTLEYVLTDKKLGTETAINTKDYPFTALKTDSLNRFDLQLRQVEIVATGAQKASAAIAMQILSSPHGFLVKSPMSGTGTIEILDATGNRVSVLKNVSIVSGNNFFTPILPDAVYLVKVTLGNISSVGQVSIIK